MSRDDIKNTKNKIALLATGDEITHGDIFNSNSQVIAQKLFIHGMHVGLHITVPDNISEIQHAMTFLLKNHRALIITGGLGPTSDDITRYALGKTLNRPLLFDENSWDAICERFKSLGYKEQPPEGNRQQALFPEGATIIPNPGGTAAGCMIEHNEHWIFMLPGPPIECIPMVDKTVLPTLKQADFQEVLYYNSWLLFGVSEGTIAEELDALAKPFDCTTGYRLAYPYIEFKLYSNHEKDFKTLVSLVEKVVARYLISDGKMTASDMLKKKIAQLNSVISICDFATGGLLENTLKTPATFSKLNFFDQANPTVQINGLDDFWHGKNDFETNLEIIFSNGKTDKKQIPFRGSRVKQYAVEYICQQIHHYLNNHETAAN